MWKLENSILQVQAFWARLASYFKSEWELGDYPIRVAMLPASEPESNSHRKSHSWVALVINWPGMAGSANSKVEALEDLRKNFERRRSENPKLPLPRPGTKVPIQFADNYGVSRHSELASDFVKQVFGVEWAWISDESSLWDFHSTGTKEELYKKIRGIYGVDVSDIASGNLKEIFDRISITRIPRVV